MHVLESDAVHGVLAERKYRAQVNQAVVAAGWIFLIRTIRWRWNMTGVGKGAGERGITPGVDRGGDVCDGGVVGVVAPGYRGQSGAYFPRRSGEKIKQQIRCGNTLAPSA